MSTLERQGRSGVPGPLALPSELEASGYVAAGLGPGLGMLLVRAGGRLGVDGSAPALLARPVATLGCRALEERLERLSLVKATGLAPLELLRGPGRCWMLRPWVCSTAADEEPAGRRVWAAWLGKEGREVLESLWAHGFLHGHLAASNLGISPEGERWLLDGGIRWVGVSRRPAPAEERRALGRLIAALLGEDAVPPAGRRGRWPLDPRLREGADGLVSRSSGVGRVARRWAGTRVAAGVTALVASGVAALWWSAGPTAAGATAVGAEPVRSPGDPVRRTSKELASRDPSAQTAMVPSCALAGVEEEPVPCELRVVAGRRVEAEVDGAVVGDWVVGQSGDIVVLGRWWCGPVAEAAAYDPRTGVVSLFGGWPSASGGQLRAVAVRRSGVLGGRVVVEDAGPAGRCQRLVVRVPPSRH